jgi:DNA primase
LAGRSVLIWPDHDDPGAKYADAAGRLALAAGARSVGILDLAGIATDPASG